MWTTEEFRQHLRGALVHLYDPRSLRNNPLAAILGQDRRADVALAVQNVLIDAIDSLKPGPDVPPESRASRNYHLLLYRYVQQLSQEEVADQLGLSVRHLRREQRAALQALARRLWEQFHLLDWVCERAAVPQVDAILPIGIPGLEAELAWLKDAPVDEPTDVDREVAAAIELAQPLAQQSGTRLEAAAEGLPLLAVHPIALRQILLNLLTVAISHTPGGLVRISARPAQSEVDIQLTCAQPRPGPRPSLDQEGDALQIARRLAELCRGRLSFHAEHEAFCASLVVPSLEQVSILVIDDNAETLEFLQRYTLGTRYRLLCTRDPKQAQNLVAEHWPRAIVLDVMMPQTDGWTVLGQLQQHPLTRHIPIVICTVMPQEALALSLGASAFLHKPVTRQAFLAALDRVLAAKA